MDQGSALARAQQAHAALLGWLVDEAFPVWATRGFDAAHGAFHERLTADGTLADDPRRARVATRQVYAFSCAPGLGWAGPARELVEAGLAFFLGRYRRPDGLFRTLVARDGAPLDERVALYDQSFALLALASCQQLLGPVPEVLEQGTALRERLHRHMKRPRGFDSGVPEALPLQSNPHMHLFESALAWCAVSADPAWKALADEIGALALEHFIQPQGALPELFDEHWAALPEDTKGQAIEPGHQFEWCWLLLCWDAGRGGAARLAAERLFEIGSGHGLRSGVAINALHADFSVKDAATRLWPQTEWLKAASLLGALTGQARYWESAVLAATALQRFLDHPARGLWHDKLTPQGAFVPEPAPASSLYHIVCAIAEFGAALKRSG
jgi:mannose/cellobiose epimerase-like protein (N-acyl-D-glucosamine 2-epimerase family)